MYSVFNVRVKPSLDRILLESKLAVFAEFWYHSTDAIEQFVGRGHGRIRLFWICWLGPDQNLDWRELNPDLELVVFRNPVERQLIRPVGVSYPAEVLEPSTFDLSKQTLRVDPRRKLAANHWFTVHEVLGRPARMFQGPVSLFGLCHESFGFSSPKDSCQLLLMQSQPSPE